MNNPPTDPLEAVASLLQTTAAPNTASAAKPRSRRSSVRKRSVVVVGRVQFQGGLTIECSTPHRIWLPLLLSGNRAG